VPFSFKKRLQLMSYSDWCFVVNLFWQNHYN